MATKACLARGHMAICLSRPEKSKVKNRDILTNLLRPPYLFF